MTNVAMLQIPVGQLVRQKPGRARVFEQMGIDYCCHGGTMLATACRERGLNVEQVCGALECEEAAAVPEQVDWSVASLAELIAHIVTTHHAYLRKELPRLSGLLDKVVAAHGDDEPELLEVRRVYRALVEELSAHMLKEERLLFPMIRQMEAARGIPASYCGGVQNPIRVMEHEHDQAGGALARIRFLTNDYTLPPGACTTYQVLFAGLQALELDLHTHIHKENNILFPRALELQPAVTGLRG